MSSPLSPPARFSALVTLGSLGAALTAQAVQGGLGVRALVLVTAVAAALGALTAYREHDAGKNQGQLLIAAVGLAAAAAVLGLFLLWWLGPLAAFGLAALAVLPFDETLRRTGWAAPLYGLLKGPLLWWLAGLLGTAPWWHPLLWGLPAGLVIASWEAARGTRGRSFWVLVGPLASAAVFAALPLWSILPWTFFIVAAALPPLCVPFWRAVLRRGWTVEHAEANLASLGQLYILFLLLTLMAWLGAALL